MRQLNASAPWALIRHEFDCTASLKFEGSAARTAIGKFGGSLAKIPAPELGAIAIQAALQRAKLAGEQVGEVIMGQVLTAGSGQNPARQALIKAGLPHGVPGMTINKVCGSGLKAVMLATQAIRDGDSEIVVIVQ